MATLVAMPRPVVPGIAIERLLVYLHDGAPMAPRSGELARWLGESRRFRSFVEVNRDKIRKKLRGAADAEAHRDVRAELRVAHLLRRYRRSHAGIGTVDLIIAATALELSAPLATVNVRHFPMFEGLRPPYEPKR